MVEDHAFEKATCFVRVNWVDASQSLLQQDLRTTGRSILVAAVFLIIPIVVCNDGVQSSAKVWFYR